jgi:DHA1 family multidrug resistance protein-like MFS transporter
MAAISGFSFCMTFMRLYLRDELGLTDDAERAWWTGIIQAAPGFVMVFSAPLWGMAADRIGRKLMVMRAMFGGALVVALMGLARTPGALLALRLGQGALTGTVTASAALVASVSPAARAGFSLGLMQAAIFAGMTAGPLLGGICADALGYRATFFIAAGMLFCGGALIALLAEEGPSHPRAGASADDADPRGEGLWGVLARPGFVVVAGLVLVMNLSRTVAAPIFQEFVEILVEEKDAVNASTGVLVAVTSGLAALTSVSVGWLADRGLHVAMLVAATVLSGLLCLPQACVETVGSLFALRVAIGVTSGAIGPAMGRFVHLAAPRSCHGKAYGLVQSASSMGIAMGPVAGGLFNAWLTQAYDTEFGLRMPFVLTGAMQVVVGLGAWFLLRRRGRRPSGAALLSPSHADETCA